MRFVLSVLAMLLTSVAAYAGNSPFMTNVFGRNVESLNGKWSVLID
jgi:hypothetical protein